MAEVLLITFLIFILLGQPISIALGVGALVASFFYSALNPIIIPTRFVGLLSDSYLLLSAPLFILAAISPPAAASRASSSILPLRWSVASVAVSPTSTSSTACSSAASRARRCPTCRRSAPS